MNAEIKLEISNEIVAALTIEAEKNGISLQTLASDILTHAVTHTENTNTATNKVA